MKLRPKPKYVDPLAGIHRAIHEGMRHSLAKRGELADYDEWRRRRAYKMKYGSAR